MSVLNTTWHHIRRSPFQSLTALVVMFICFLTLTFFIVISSGLSSVLKYFETKPEITLFLKDGLDSAATDNLRKELSNYPNIKEIKFISKEKALELYKEQNKENPLLTEMVTASILPASIEIKVSDPKVLEQIFQNYSIKTNIVDQVIYQKDIINSLLDWTNVIRKTGVVIASVIGIISFFTIFTIVGMKITNRKEEIKITRLLGASKFYVKKPFLLEGIFYGVLGSLIGTAVSFIVIFILKSNINTFFQPVEFITSNYTFYLIVFLSELIIGITLGLLASWIGAKRYIKF